MGAVTHFISHVVGDVGHAVTNTVGDITDTLGITHHKQEQQANNRANLEANRAYGLTTSQLDFQKQQYADWKHLYGTMQEKQAHYVNNYDGANVVANQLMQNNLGAQQARQNISSQLAQRGIGGSGLEASALTQIGQQQYQQDAAIRNNQSTIASNKRMQFLGLGLGQGTQMLGTIGGVSNNGVNSATNLSGQQANLAGRYGTQGMLNMTNLYGIGSKAFGSYLGGKYKAGGQL